MPCGKRQTSRLRNHARPTSPIYRFEEPWRIAPQRCSHMRLLPVLRGNGHNCALGAGNTPSRCPGVTGATRRHSRELYRHWLPARHPHPLATGRERCHWRADANRHGCEFHHRDGWGTNTLYRCIAERQFRLGARGRLGVGCCLRVSDYHRLARKHAVLVAPAFREKRSHGGCRRLRLFRSPCGDRLLSVLERDFSPLRPAKRMQHSQRRPFHRCPTSIRAISEINQPEISCAALAAYSGFRRAHSQTVATRHPLSRSEARTALSRAVFAPNFAAQNSARVDGVVV